MFSGIGGFELGIRRSAPDARCVGHSETDRHAASVYERHFEGHVNHGDATRIDTRRLPGFGLLVAGFPCQAFSLAGRRRGFEDSRGTLFFDVARVLADRRPGHLVLENVRDLLGHDGGRTLQVILGVLTDLGYRVEWQVLDSQDFGVPQRRTRIYLVGHLAGRCGRTVLPPARPGGGRDRRPGGARVVGRTRLPTVRVREATKAGYARATVGDTINVSYPNCRTRRGRVQRGRAGTLLTHESMATLTASGRLRRLTPVEYERLQGFPDDWTRWGADDREMSDRQRYRMCGNAVTVDVVAALIASMGRCLS